MPRRAAKASKKASASGRSASGPGAVADRSPIGIYRADLDGTLTYVNAAFARILGVDTPKSLVGKREDELFFRDDEGSTSEAHAAQSGELQFSREARFRKVDGSPVWIALNGFRLEDKNGGMWEVFVREVEDRREKESALAELLNMMQTIPDILYTLDADAKLVRWNRKLETITGYAADQLRGKAGFELFPESQQQTFAKAIMDAFASGYAEFETEILTQDGSTIDYQWTAVPLEDARGRVIGVAGAGRDITERKRSEQEQTKLQAVIRARANEWQQTFDAIDSVIVLADLDGRIVRLNRAAKSLTGAEWADLIGRRIGSVGSGEPWQTFAAMIANLEPGQQTSAAQAHDPLSQRAWDIGLSRSHDPEPTESEKVIVIARDITRLIELQEVARKNQVMSAVGSLIVGVAHEVRNPIFGISATLDAFEAELADNPSSREFVEVLRAEVQRLSSLMEDLLDYGRPARMEFFDLEIGDVIQRSVRACSLMAERAGVKIETKIATGLPAIPLDQRRLVQVFQNLIENAVQHSPRDSVVTIEASRRDDYVAVEVRDQGNGFNPIDLPRIFEPFFTKRRGGTGLGLSIVQRIVEEHGGSITASNRSGGGAMMTVELPMAPSAVPLSSDNTL